MLGLRTRPAAADRPIGRYFSAAEGRRARALGVAVGVVLLGLLTGCNSNPEPEALPSESPSATSQSPSPSASPTPTPPTMPAAAKATSEASAKAFARFYIESINYAMRTGSTHRLRSLGANDCTSCTAIARNIEDVYGAGGHIKSDGWTLNAIRSLQVTRARAVMSLDVTLEPEVVVASAGAKPEKNQGGKQPMTIFLNRTSSTWSVAKVDLVA